MGRTSRKKMLVISHVLPFPGESGQEKRIYHNLVSLRRSFHITFLTVARRSDIAGISKQLERLCDDVICLPSRFDHGSCSRSLHKVIGGFFSAISARRFSNYVVGHLELTPKRVQSAIESREFDVVLYEYWHAFRSVSVFRKQKIPCILDMHNVLWASYEQQEMRRRFLPGWLKQQRIRKYRTAEKHAWNEFDGIVAINPEERSCVESHTNDQTKIFLAPMGVDLDNWPYVWGPKTLTRRVAYYGGLASAHNQQSALACYHEIMPAVWDQFPETEFWIIGSNPPPSIRELSKDDPRVIVTGFVENVQEILADTSVVVCPWKGKYGFRSRVVELVASGVPLVSTPDAIHGMDLENYKDILLGSSMEELTRCTLNLLNDPQRSRQQSLTGRQTIEKHYSTANTYDKLSRDINDWLVPHFSVEHR